MVGSADVLIVGGGVIGLTAAYYLALENVRVTLIDQGDFGREASWAGAGILPPAPSADSQDAFNQLHRQSILEFPNLSSDLLRQTGLDNGYRVCGGLEFAAGTDSGHEGEWSGPGVEVEQLSELAACQREPGLGPDLGPAKFLPGLAQVRNPRHMRALTEACRLLGVDLRPHCPLLNITHDSSRITGIQTNREELHCQRLLITTGAWTAAVAQKLGCVIPVRPIRGQIALFRMAPPLLRHVLMWGARYIVPREDGRVLVGSTEEDVGFKKQTTEEAIASLIELATRLVPQLGQAPVEKTWAGLRPGSPDGKPFIGRIPNWKNGFVAAGHFRSGIQLSPGTGLLCRDLLLDCKPAISLESLRPDRFSQSNISLPFPS
ncbi:glycine oxidase ThiO [soil metagenome]